MTKTDPAQPRAVHPRLWQGLATSGAIALATVPAWSQGMATGTPMPGGGMLILAQAEGGEGGVRGA